MIFFIKSFRIGLILLFLLGITTGGCRNWPIHESDPIPFEKMESEDINKEIARLEKIVGDNQATEEISEFFLQLALLYSHSKNSAPQYDRSLDMLQIYTCLDSQGSKNSDILSLQGLLEKIATLSDEKKLLNKELMNAKKDAFIEQEQKDRLLSENKKLQEIIEQLKLLELRLEESRRMKGT